MIVSFIFQIHKVHFYLVMMGTDSTSEFKNKGGSSRRCLNLHFNRLTWYFRRVEHERSISHGIILIPTPTTNSLLDHLIIIMIKLGVDLGLGMSGPQRSKFICKKILLYWKKKGCYSLLYCTKISFNIKKIL